MPFVCKNGYTGVCGTSRGCYCFCNNAYQGDCEEKCFCNIGTDSNPYLQGLGSKTGYIVKKGTSAPSQGQMKDLVNEMKSAMKDVSISMRQVGLTARQNNTNLLSEIPYFGVPPDTYKNKSIIPLNESRRFLDTIETLTDNEDFNEAGRIAVLKSRLLGPAQEYFTDYTGGADWARAKQYLLDMYPEVISYPTIKENIHKMKRESGEQISNYATRILKAYNTLQRVHPSHGYSDATKQSDSIIKLLDILPEADRLWIRTENEAVNTFSNVLQQILIYVEKRTNLKLSMDAIQKESSSKPGTIEVNQVFVNSGGKITWLISTVLGLLLLSF